MAKISPFKPYRYAAKAGDINQLVTQPYDKITPAMQRRYLDSSPYNLVRVILGQRFDDDTEENNVYTRAGNHFRDWIRQGLLVQDTEPAFYPYFQEFEVPDTGERLVRKGFIGLGAVEDYSANVVYRHEQTLSGPKKDRRQVLEHTGAHFGQIFMLYPDKECRVDAILDEAAKSDPIASVTDEYGTIHRLYRISDPARIAEIQQIMSDKKLLIADGHHRYETALGYKQDNPNLPEAQNVMMTFVNMYSPGLRILATHRVLGGLENFNRDELLKKAELEFTVEKLDSIGQLNQRWEQIETDKIRIGVAFQGTHDIYLLSQPREGKLDVAVLHTTLLEGILGVTAEAIREERANLKYVRGVEAAVDLVTNGPAQVAFLLEATTIEQVAETSFGGGVMPQKSTDFYPKLLTGMAIYRVKE